MIPWKQLPRIHRPNAASTAQDAGHCKWHTVRAIHRRHRDVNKIEFATLPTAVGEESEDDKTAEMDTVDREDKKHTKGDFWNWEMRK
jgi:hypothetical protein